MQSNSLAKVSTVTHIHPCPSPYKLCHRNISGVDQTTTVSTFPFPLSFSLFLWYFFFLLSSHLFLKYFIFSLLTSILYLTLSSRFFYFLYYALMEVELLGERLS